MSSKNFGALLVALVVGALGGYWIAHRAPTTGAPTTGAPPPLAPAQVGCVAWQTVEYDYATGEAHLVPTNTIEPKSIDLLASELVAGSSQICWELKTVHQPKGAPDPEFDWVDLDLAKEAGPHGQVITGSGHFNLKGKHGDKQALYANEPYWKTIQWDGSDYEGVRIGFRIRLKLKGQPPIEADPDLVIRKDK